MTVTLTTRVAAVNDRGVLYRGSVGSLGLTQPVVVPTQDGLLFRAGFVGRGSADSGVLAHPAAKLLVGGVVGERGPGWLRDGWVVPVVQPARASRSALTGGVVVPP
ncbi:hypothetical protein ACFV1L_21105 [Kitasatospora sp. NPDC059646]|uniref:hypothetical protein n=1 Tax=Kitasatospora sp. NPDC059646 TaxID=3346893 RepID=UPI0036AC6F4D